MSPKYSLEIICLGKRRVIALLDRPGKKSVNAPDWYKSLQGADKRYFLKSFEYWVEGFQQNKRFHGWDAVVANGKYKECFVFKQVATQTRIYGFLHRLKDGTLLEVCVLVELAQKKEDNTDFAILDRILEIANDDVLRDELSKLQLEK